MSQAYGALLTDPDRSAANFPPCSLTLRERARLRALPLAAHSNSFTLVRIALAALLFSAAGLKAQELFTVPAAALPLPWGWSVALVQFELAAACWILLAPSPGWAWWAALLTFGLFAVAAATKWASGAADCGCFGRLPTRPWQSLLVDLTALAALLMVRPRILPIATIAGRETRAILPLPSGEARVEGRPRRLARLLPFTVAWLLVAPPLTAALAAFRPGATSAPGPIAGAGNLMVLEPEKWPGQRWPLLDFVDRGGELSAGRWQVVLYHHECPKCQALLAQLAANPASFPLPVGEGRGEVHQLALVEAPPFGDLPNEVSSRISVRTKLASDREWYGPLPIQVWLVNGRVEEVASGR